MIYDDVASWEDAAQVSEPLLKLYARRPAEWLEPPRQWVLPAALPWTRVLAQAMNVRVLLTGIRVWTESFTVDVEVFARQAPPRTPDWLAPFGKEAPRQAGAGGLRVEAWFADGRRAVRRGSRPWLNRRPEDEKPPDGPVLLAGRGEGGPFHYRQSAHIWPLPPSGPVVLAITWRDQGITSARADLSGLEIRAAAERAVEIWPGLPEAPNGLPGTAQKGRDD